MTTPLTPTEILKRPETRARKLNKWAKTEREKKRNRLIMSRFSDSTCRSEHGRQRSRGVGGAKYLLVDVERALVMLKAMSYRKVAAATGINITLLKTLAARNKPLNPEVYTGAKDVRRIVRLAIAEHARSGEAPVRCLKNQWIAAGLNGSSLDVHLSMERIPFPLTFEVYHDPKAQMRCAVMWNTAAGEDVVIPASLARAGSLPKQALPSASPAPIAPRGQHAPATSLLSRRRRIGYDFQLSRTTLRR